METEKPNYAPERPISGITIEGFDDQHFARVKEWLNGLGCTFERDAMRPGVYQIWLPAGSIERTPLGRSTQWRHVTEIVLPNRHVITKYRVTGISTNITSTTIGIPSGII